MSMKDRPLRILIRIRPLADRYRDLVIRTYGQERGERVRLIEALMPLTT